MTANLTGASPEHETESRSPPSQPLPAARRRFAANRYDGTVRTGSGGQSAAAAPA